MTQRYHSLRKALLAGSMLAAAWPALAANVTPDRLVNADREPQNWLMNHRTYDGQRFSPLARINKGNVKGLKLAYAVPLGGSAGNEYVEATPLVENGFLYITDSWGVLYKIDGTSGDTSGVHLPRLKVARPLHRDSRPSIIMTSRRRAPNSSGHAPLLKPTQQDSMRP